MNAHERHNMDRHRQGQQWEHDVYTLGTRTAGELWQEATVPWYARPDRTGVFLDIAAFQVARLCSRRLGAA